MDIETYLEALASAAPTPGGGSAATIVAALGASLVAMVARITRANPAFDEKAERAEAVIAAADALRIELIAAREEDETAYGLVVEAMALPRSTAEEKALRTSRLQAGLAGAAAAPLHAASLAARGLRLARDAGALGNAHLASDVTCAAAFARAALEASAANVRINHRFLHDAEFVRIQEAALTGFEREAASAD